MAWVLTVVLIGGAIALVRAVARGRRDFDNMVAPADDLRRADDGGSQSLGMRDGTGGLI